MEGRHQPQPRGKPQPGRGKGGARRGAPAGGREGREGRGGVRGDRGQAASARGGQPEPTPGAPPRRPRRTDLKKPVLPEERPRIERSVFNELRGAAPPGLLDDVVKAYGAAGDALARDDAPAAVAFLEWAKSVASRSPAIREALGVARYHLGDFAAAAAELSAYRRLSGRNDQNHLLADCARAMGRPDKAEEYVREMLATRGVPRDRAVEGLIVLAGAAADRGDPGAALDVLRRAGLEPDRVEAWHPRLWYAAAEFAEQAGDLEAARDYLGAVVSVDAGFLDAAERLAALEPPAG